MNQVMCPYCNKQFPLSQGLSHELKEKMESEKQKEIAETKQKMNEEAKKWREEKQKEIEEKAREKIELDFKNKQNEAEELRKEKTTLQNQVLEISKSMRQLRTERDQEKIENEKKLVDEVSKIREKEKKQLDEEYKFKLLEKDKQLQDAIKVADEFKRKAEQKSQQLQGEVLELELENILKREFPYDEIQEVPKGVIGADVIQIVKDNHGKICGKIIWESKRTKNWSDGWIQKLRDDQRRVKANLAVLISQTLPPHVKNFTIIDEIRVGNFDSIFGLGLLLRNFLIEMAMIESSMTGKQEKKEILWNYLTSLEFRHRLDAIYDAMNLSKENLEKEKEFFRRKWAREEKNLSLITENLLGMHGDLQAIVGKSLLEIKGLALPIGDKEKDTLF